MAQRAAGEDVTFIEAQMAGYYDRLDLWYQRVWKLQGLWLDPNGRVLRHEGKEGVLAHREFGLLQFLLDHPHRFYTASQITGHGGQTPRCPQRKSATTFCGLGKSWLGWKVLVTWSTDPVAVTP